MPPRTSLPSRPLSSDPWAAVTPGRPSRTSCAVQSASFRIATPPFSLHGPPRSALLSSPLPFLPLLLPFRVCILDQSIHDCRIKERHALPSASLYRKAFHRLYLGSPEHPVDGAYVHGQA